MRVWKGGGGVGRGRGVWNSLISKHLAHYSLSLKLIAYSLKNNPLFFKILIDFRQFLYDSVEKVPLKAFFFFFLHDRNAKANTSTQSEYTAYIICSRT